MSYISGVYLISNQVAGKHYIGSAIDIIRRWGEHRRMLRRGGHENRHLQHAWDKYGEDAFSWTVLLYCDNKNLLLFEQRALDVYRVRYGWRMLYNANLSAASRLGSKASEESRAKMRASNTRPFQGRKHSEETRATIAELAKQRWTNPEFRAKYIGREVSEETKAKIGDANRGKSPSIETRKKLSIAGKGKVVSEETRKKLTRSPRYLGKKHTEETKKQISATLKGRTFSEETRRKISEGVKAWRARIKQAQELPS